MQSSGFAPDSRPCVLLVEADRSFARQVRADAGDAGYALHVAPDVKSAWQQYQELQPALVAIDCAHLGPPGLTLCRRIRATGTRIPLLLLMARASVEDRVACLEAGADDYIAPPYRADLFLQLMRLYLQPAEEETEQLHFGDLVLDIAMRRAIRNTRSIDLTMKEFELLKYLMLHPGEVLTREQILENVWSYDYAGESNVIEVYIRYLRIKMEDEGEKRLIQTVRGVGYVLRES
ncbi:two component transcriptional regulator, winged-helix family [Rubidibacter lacunae KORDI 51-2]|uniref:Two component transcriptional regulator, winged-helix family n=1 Tax=Rubidibacter lacunae KORDI 51-2 TaxID=582515 RepID=U5DTP4_9CHRO|nr:two component transcriptional regulator, winged-helix family [Rubidibacter lacunae KORDI 51-2]